MKMSRCDSTMAAVHHTCSIRPTACGCRASVPRPPTTEPALWLAFIPCVSFLRAGSSAVEQGTFNPKVVGSIPTRPTAPRSAGIDTHGGGHQQQGYT
jgi:hypothetical protein